MRGVGINIFYIYYTMVDTLSLLDVEFTTLMSTIPSIITIILLFTMNGSNLITLVLEALYYFIFGFMNIKLVQKNYTISLFNKSGKLVNLYYMIIISYFTSILLSYHNIREIPNLVTLTLTPATPVFLFNTNYVFDEDGGVTFVAITGQNINQNTQIKYSDIIDKVDKKNELASKIRKNITDKKMLGKISVFLTLLEEVSADSFIETSIERTNIGDNTRLMFKRKEFVKEDLTIETINKFFINRDITPHDLFEIQKQIGKQIGKPLDADSPKTGPPLVRDAASWKWKKAIRFWISNPILSYSQVYLTTASYMSYLSIRGEPEQFIPSIGNVSLIVFSIALFYKKNYIGKVIKNFPELVVGIPILLNFSAMHLLKTVFKVDLVKHLTMHTIFATYGLGILAFYRMEKIFQAFNPTKLTEFEKAEEQKKINDGIPLTYKYPWKGNIKMHWSLQTLFLNINFGTFWMLYHQLANSPKFSEYAASNKFFYIFYWIIASIKIGYIDIINGNGFFSPGILIGYIAGEEKKPQNLIPFASFAVTCVLIFKYYSINKTKYWKFIL